MAALLDGDGVAGRRSQVDGRPRRSAVKRNAVLLGQDGHVVGADLVGEVAVGGDAVRAHDNGLDLAGAHQAGGHVVADDGGGNAVGHQLPRREPRALQKGPRLVGVDVDLFALLHGSADHAQRRAVAAGGQCAGVAVGQHAAFVRQQRAAEAPMALQAAMSSSYMACASARILSCTVAMGVSGAKPAKQLLHAVDGPEQVHRRGPRSRQPRADLFELGLEFFGRFRGGLGRAQRNAVGRRNANGRRAAHDHGDNHLGHLLIVGGEYVALFEREPGLVDEADAFRRPCKGGNHAFSV
jgi:hypothetical protein